MDRALPLESAVPFTPNRVAEPVSTDEEAHEPSVIAGDTEDGSKRWNIPAILSLNAVGAVAFKYGLHPEDLPPEMLTMKWGPYFPAGSLRHLAVGSVIAGVCELGFALSKQSHQKIKAFTLTQLPSIGYEVFQGLTLGHFGYGDIATAAATSGLQVLCSTKKGKKKKKN